MAQAHITISDSAPAAAPTEIGDHWIDTVAGKEYRAMGTSSPSDWKEVGLAGGSLKFSFIWLENQSSPGTYHKVKLRNNVDGFPEIYPEDAAS